MVYTMAAVESFNGLVWAIMECAYVAYRYASFPNFREDPPSFLVRPVLLCLPFVIWLV
jgi:hypothetical protein